MKNIDLVMYFSNYNIELNNNIIYTNLKKNKILEYIYERRNGI